MSSEDIPGLKHSRDSAVADVTSLPESGPWLALDGIEKRFGGVRALRGASIVLQQPGTIHGLIGENGSGKSTLLGVLSGQLRPDRGGIFLQGREVEFASPVNALQNGIAMVAQETALALDLSIAENIFLGRRMARSSTGIDWPATRRHAREVLSRLQLDYDPGESVRRLRPDQRQMVEIARALSMDARLLILDEPTSSLTDDEVDALFSAVRHVQREGVSTIFVSHRINEMFELTNEITVLRDGITAATGQTSGFDSHSLVDVMVGQKDSWRPSSHAREGREISGGRPVLEVSGLQIPGLLADIDVQIGRGEIVGVAGLVGAGRSELLEAIFGVRVRAAGRIVLDGEECEIRSARAAIERKMGYLPPDRKAQGLILRRTIIENINIVKDAFISRLRRPNARRNARTVADLKASMGIRVASPRATAGSLSGGNQQKVALGKWLAASPKVLLLDEPTRGVDVAAKAEIHDLLRAASVNGMALFISSSENSELLELCDRILVMFRGRITASLTSDMATEALLAKHAGGHT